MPQSLADAQQYHPPIVPKLDRFMLCCTSLDENLDAIQETLHAEFELAVGIVFRLLEDP